MVFYLGPFGAPFLVPTAAVVIAVLRRPVWLLWGGGVVTVWTALAWVVFLWFWGEGFDYADANRPVPTGIDAAMNIAAVVCAGGVAILMVLLVATVVDLRRDAARVG